MTTTLEIAPDAVSKVMVKQTDFIHALEYDIRPVCLSTPFSFIFSRCPAKDILHLSKADTAGYALIQGVPQKMSPARHGGYLLRI